MSRALTTKNVIDKKHSTFQFDGQWLQIFGEPEKAGAWLIYGKDKNGKTWGTLLIAQYLSKSDKVLYISAEQGISKSFKDALVRAKINPNNNKLHYSGYISLDELYEVLNRKRSAPTIVVIDNITFYTDELKNGAFRKLLKDFPKTLFIFLAHEERGEPYTATATLCKKVAEIIIHVKGLKLLVGGRCPGGEIDIDEEKAALYHGHTKLSA